MVSRSMVAAEGAGRTAMAARLVGSLVAPIPQPAESEHANNVTAIARRARRRQPFMKQF
jgi:hypothetical protein